MWRYHGQQRPDFAITPGPDEESVWDYPRPPRLESDDREVVVRTGDRSICRTRGAVRVLETASPPTFYLPRNDVDLSALVQVGGSSFCEWKGAATYWSLADDPELRPVGWSYDAPSRAFESLRGSLSFYPARVDCTVGGERVRPQPGGFYGGWVTDEVVGPFKGDPGTGHW